MNWINSVTCIHFILNMKVFMLSLWRWPLCHLFWNCIFSYPHSNTPSSGPQVTQRAGVPRGPQPAPWSDSWASWGWANVCTSVQSSKRRCVEWGGIKTWHWGYKYTSWTIPLVFHLPSCSRVQGCQLMSQWMEILVQQSVASLHHWLGCSDPTNLALSFAPL